MMAGMDADPMADAGPTADVDLASGERARLDRFAAEFDRLSASEYAMFAVHGDTETIEAVRVASAMLGRAPRKAAVNSAVAAFSEAANAAYDRRLSVSGTFMLYQVLPGQPQDRVRFLASLERVVVGLILWNELDEEHLGASLGPWAETIERAGIT